MHVLRRVVDYAGVAVMAMVSVAILVSMLAGTADALGGQLFNSPVPGAVEGSANMVAVITFGSLAYIQRRRGHIRVELVYLRFGPRGQAVLDLVNALVILAFFVLMGWQLWDSATSSLAVNERAPGIVRFPIYPVKFAMVVGVGLMILQVVVDAVDYTHRFIHPDAGADTGGTDEQGDLSGAPDSPIRAPGSVE